MVFQCVYLYSYSLCLQRNNLKKFYIILVKNINFISMNTFIVVGILVEVGIAIGGIYFIKQLQKRQTKQPSLSRKIIRNLKF